MYNFIARHSKADEIQLLLRVIIFLLFHLWLFRKKKKMEDVESMPQKKRDAFEKLKSKNVDKFRKELDTRIE